jgi:hypothetical protein
MTSKALRTFFLLIGSLDRISLCPFSGLQREVLTGKNRRHNVSCFDNVARHVR